MTYVNEGESHLNHGYLFCGDVQYFTLLAHMLEVYPEKVAKLSPDGFSRIVGTLDFGLHHQVPVCAVFTIPSCKVINTINRPIETMNESYISWKYREPFLVCIES